MKKLSIEENQKVEYEILTKIDELCRMLNLRYYLVYGTLLGAVRHKGFIPWDDDLDIMMPRPDYMKLISYFEKNKDELFPLKAVYAWHDYIYSYAMARVTNMEYKLVFTDTGPYSYEDMGLFVDIYPYDGVGDNISEALKISKKSLSLIHWIGRAYYNECQKTNSNLKGFFQPLAYRYAHLIGQEHYHKKLKALISLYAYDKSELVAPLSWHEATYYLNKEVFGDGCEIEFCNRKFRAPADFDAYLKKLYGDYMMLPPEKDRVPTHFYDAYVRKEYEMEIKCNDNA